MSLPTDKQVKDAIGTIWTNAATAMSESVRVIPRWKLSLRGKEPIQALRSLGDDKKINGVYITRVQRKSKRTAIGGNEWEYKWTYAMFYFRSYDDLPDPNNSEDKANAYIEKVAELFEQSGDLGLEIDEHEGLQVENIDTIDLRVHAFQCFLTVNMTKQG